MKLHKHFLPQDLEKASREYHCYKDLLIRMQVEADSGRMEQAKLTSIDLTKSLHELNKLLEKKYQHEKMLRVAEMMGTAGVHVQVVRKMLHE